MRKSLGMWLFRNSGQNGQTQIKVHDDDSCDILDSKLFGRWKRVGSELRSNK